MTKEQRDRIECAIRHIDSSLDVDPWARDIAIDAMQRLLEQAGCRQVTGKLDDTISRQDTIDAVENCEPGEELFVIKSLPSVQPERKTGRWVYGEDDVAMCDGYHCSKCGFFVPWDYKRKFIDFIKDYNFCPNCGAEMSHDNT